MGVRARTVLHVRSIEEGSRLSSSVSDGRGSLWTPARLRATLPLKGVPKSWTRSRVYRGKQIVRSGRIFCTKRIESAEVVDPETPRAGKAATRAFFGATVRYANAAATKRVVSIVGTDEVDLNRNHISWVSPLGRALMKSPAGDRIVLQVPGGTAYLTVLKVCYERVSVEPFREPPR